MSCPNQTYRISPELPQLPPRALANIGAIRDLLPFEDNREVSIDQDLVRLDRVDDRFEADDGDPIHLRVYTLARLGIASEHSIRVTVRDDAEVVAYEERRR